MSLDWDLFLSEVLEETNPLELIQGFDVASEYENYRIKAYLNEVNSRVDFIIKK